MESVPEILLIDKPKGITSFDVIRRLRKELNIKKIGHAGTLDPLATGLMILGVGPGTKRLDEYIKLSKEYVAEVMLGEKRSTGDMEGEVLESIHIDAVDEDLVKEELRNMVGVLRLPVSAYSAIKKDGVPMYKRARRGEEVVLPIRDMEVMETELLESSCGEGRCILTIHFYVGSGTYIRSLGEELGRRLGYPATLKNLRRTKVGDFSIDDARTLE
jgi:tRNA pseudouridine55 synthase